MSAGCPDPQRELTALPRPPTGDGKGGREAKEEEGDGYIPPKYKSWLRAYGPADQGLEMESLTPVVGHLFSVCSSDVLPSSQCCLANSKLYCVVTGTPIDDLQQSNTVTVTPCKPNSRASGRLGRLHTWGQLHTAETLKTVE